jgi:hypothetical protein
VLQNAANDGGIFDDREEPQAAAAAWTRQHVEAERPTQERGPAPYRRDPATSRAAGDRRESACRSQHVVRISMREPRQDRSFCSAHQKGARHEPRRQSVRPSDGSRQARQLMPPWAPTNRRRQYLYTPARKVRCASSRGKRARAPFARPRLKFQVLAEASCASRFQRS